VRDLAHIARRLGGEAFGNQVNCPGPGHSPRDRSLSVKFTGDGFVVNSHAGDDWAACRDHVRSLLGDAPSAQPMRLALPHETEKNLHRARHLWSCRHDPADTVVETYIRTRGCSAKTIPASLGYLEPSAYPWPAMIAAFGIAEEPEPGEIKIPEVRGVHLTFLKPDGSGKADIDKPKIMLGPSCGFPIVVAQPNDLLGLAITEGIEDALSVREATGFGAWAAGSASRMAALATRIPGYIDTLTIFSHSDDAGERGAYALASALSSLGVEVLMEGAR
jgi:Toprim domain-containing protein